MRKVRTRFAPSPTGFIHVGGAYQAMLDYAFAKKSGGSFVLRIEDTDRERFVEGAEEKIKEGLEWLGLLSDESPWKAGDYGPYRQSERLALYREYAEKLMAEGKAYRCFCSEERLAEVREERKLSGLPPMYDRHCRNLSPKDCEKKISEGEKYVVRLKVPDNRKVIVNDFLRGKIVFESSVIDDQVLVKSDGFPTYHLAVVVDDHLMEITHAIRGEEWLSSAPKHILLYEYLGWQPPVFIHTPTLRDTNRRKLSKREGHTSLFWYKEQGYLPEALLNFLSLLGWSHPEGKEIFDRDEFIRLFELKDISPVGPIFNLEKLDWMNGEYIRSKENSELAKLLTGFLPELEKDKLVQAVPLIKERIKKLGEARELLSFLWQENEYGKEMLLGKKGNPEEIKLMLTVASEVVAEFGVDDPALLQEKLLTAIEENSWKVGQFFMAFRVAITGKTVTPPIVESLPILGKEESLTRLRSALEKIG